MAEKPVISKERRAELKARGRLHAVQGRKEIPNRRFFFPSTPKEQAENNIYLESHEEATQEKK